MKIRVEVAPDNILESSFQENLVVIGRSSKCNFVIKDDSISRYHCQIEEVEGEFFVTDLGSANGVFVAGNRIDPNVKTRINLFMPLAIGHFDCKIEEDHREVQAALKNQKESASTSKEKPTEKKNNVSSKAPVFLAAVTVVSAGVLFYSYYEKPAATPAEVIVQAPQVKPAADDYDIPSVPEAFLTEKEYQQKLKKASCETFKKECRYIHLDAAKGEGIVQEDAEIFIFMNPTLIRHYYKKLSSPENVDLLGLYQLLKSNFLSDYKSYKFAQIHLVMMGGKNKVRSAFRLHREKLDKIDISTTAKDLHWALGNESPDVFFSANSEFIPYRRL